MKENYLWGFGNHFSTEARAGALPQEQNSPQKTPFGLYPEQLSGSAFTMPRTQNMRTWLYRMRPSVMHGSFQPVESKFLITAPSEAATIDPNQMRWSPMRTPKEKTNFIDGLITFAVNGSCAGRVGCAVHLYACNTSMTDIFFYNSDGDFLIVPQMGGLELRTELGVLIVQPGHIAVIPRGVKFQVLLKDKEARGYVCENYGAPFRLPDLGPIGANGLANPRHFFSPIAAFEDREGSFTLVTKAGGKLWKSAITHSPLDVVAWSGNYTPYAYDLKLFNTINTVSFDHPDPSIFTVLTSPTDTVGCANIDFVIFPPRWMVAEHTFRPPYYHRNPMSEFMGLIYGAYDAKPDGFVPGGSSLHNCMSAHGPDLNAYSQAIDSSLKPSYIDGTMAFMFESAFPFATTTFARTSELRDTKYTDCWKNLPKAELP